MRNGFRWILALLCVAGLAAPARAQVGVATRMGFGARGMAMGNALAADAWGEASPWYNPALAPLASRQSLEAGAALLSLDRSLSHLQFVAPLRPRAGVAVGLVHAGVSGIDGRDNSGYHTEDYSTDEYAFFLAFGTRVSRRVSAGVSLELFRADYFESLPAASSIGFDVGLLAQVTDALALGLVVDDLLARYEWDTAALYGTSGRTTQDRFPTRLRLGAAYRLAGGRALLTGEYESAVRTGEHRTWQAVEAGGVPQQVRVSEDLRLQASRFRFGAEYHPARVLALRAGLDDVGAGAVRPSAGFMVEQAVGRLVARVEYGLSPEPFDAGLRHFVTLRVFL